MERGKIFQKGESIGVTGSDFGPPDAVNEKDPFTKEAQQEALKKSELSDLFLLGFIEEDKEIGNFVFKMKTLSNGEIKEITKVINVVSKDASQIVGTQDIILAYSIVSVNGVSLEDIYSGSEKEMSPLRKRLDVIKGLQSSVTTELLSFYTQISKKSESLVSVTEEELKK